MGYDPTSRAWDGPMHLVTPREQLLPGTRIAIHTPCLNDCPNHGRGDTVWYFVEAQSDPHRPWEPPIQRWLCTGLAPDDFDRPGGSNDPAEP
jgi:hypothetical protein